MEGVTTEEAILALRIPTDTKRARGEEVRAARGEEAVPRSQRRIESIVLGIVMRKRRSAINAVILLIPEEGDGSMELEYEEIGRASCRERV